MTVVLERRDGDTITLESRRWHAPASTVELDLLDVLDDPVIDLGCGPGRIVAALAERGRRALGIDASAHAVAQARRRGALALQRSVFEPLPGTGRWRTAVLLDGSIGIGGDVARLLARTADLLAPGGTALVEVEPPGSPTEGFEVRVRAAGSTSVWFPWARLSADHTADVLDGAGLRPTEVRAVGGRWFGWAVKP